MVEPLNPRRGRVLALLKRYGHNTTSFQTLEPGLAYWFAEDGEACVAYVDTGRAWVAAGGPIAAHEREAEVAAGFMAAARASGRRVRFFAVEREHMAHSGLTLLPIGEQPTWTPQDWPATLQAKRSLREQVRRARAKKVVARPVAAAAICSADSPEHQQIAELVARWKDSRAMAPMGFLVRLELCACAGERRWFVAEHAGRIVGLLAAVPLYARDGWFFEDVLRHPDAPNGTMELLFDHAMRALAAAGSQHVTYGLAPLAGECSPMLRAIRDRTRRLYDFEGLRAFKSKLMPAEWRPVYLAFPLGERGAGAVIDVLAAFAYGSFVRFGLATLRHRAAWVVRIMALLLVPWTTLLALVDTRSWFPSASVQVAWIALDCVLLVLLLRLAARWRKRLAVTISGLALADFVLGCAQAVLYNAARTSGWLEWSVLLVALAAPLAAATFLWLCRGRARLYSHALDGRPMTDVATATESRFLPPS